MCYNVHKKILSEEPMGGFNPQNFSLATPLIFGHIRNDWS